MQKTTVRRGYFAHFTTMPPVTHDTKTRKAPYFFRRRLAWNWCKLRAGATPIRRIYFAAIECSLAALLPMRVPVQRN